MRSIRSRYQAHLSSTPGTAPAMKGGRYRFTEGLNSTTRVPCRSARRITERRFSTNSSLLTRGLAPTSESAMNGWVSSGRSFSLAQMKNWLRAKTPSTAVAGRPERSSNRSLLCAGQLSLLPTHITTTSGRHRGSSRSACNLTWNELYPGTPAFSTCQRSAGRLERSSPSNRAGKLAPSETPQPKGVESPKQSTVRPDSDNSGPRKPSWLIRTGSCRKVRLASARSFQCKCGSVWNSRGELLSFPK